MNRSNIFIASYNISITATKNHPHATSFTLSGVWGKPASVRRVTSTTSTCPLVHGPQFEENDKGSNFLYYVFALLSVNVIPISFCRFFHGHSEQFWLYLFPISSSIAGALDPDKMFLAIFTICGLMLFMIVYHLMWHLPDLGRQ